MNILLIGGTGAIGKEVVKILSEARQQVTVTSRTSRENEQYVDFLEGNAFDLCFLGKVLDAKKWDCIVDFLVYSTQEFEQRIDMLLGSTKQYVFLSSARVYANSDEKIVETSSRLLETVVDDLFLETDEYPLAKARQENIIKGSRFKGWTIVRPYISYAANRLQLGVFEKEEWLYRVFQGKKIVFPRELMDKRTTLTSSRDVARAIVSLLGEESAEGEVFHVTAKQSVTWADVLSVYLNTLEHVLGARPKVVYQELNQFYRYNSKYPLIYDRLFDRVFDNSKISKFVDVDGFTEMTDGLSLCLADFAENPSFTKINWKAEAYKDRSSGDISSIKAIYGFKNKLKYFIFRFLG